MWKQQSLFKIKLAMIAAILVGTSLYISTTQGKAESHQELVDEVWQIPDKNYVDASFNHQNWQAIRQQYLNRSSSSTQQADKAIEEMVAKLGDRYTELYNPQQL